MNDRMIDKGVRWGRVKRHQLLSYYWKIALPYIHIFALGLTNCFNYVKHEGRLWTMAMDSGDGTMKKAAFRKAEFLKREGIVLNTAYSKRMPDDPSLWKNGIPNSNNLTPLFSINSKTKIKLWTTVTSSDFDVMPVGNFYRHLNNVITLLWVLWVPDLIR